MVLFVLRCANPFSPPRPTDATDATDATTNRRHGYNVQDRAFHDLGAVVRYVVPLCIKKALANCTIEKMGRSSLDAIMASVEPSTQSPPPKHTRRNARRMMTPRVSTASRVAQFAPPSKWNAPHSRDSIAATKNTPEKKVVEFDPAELITQLVSEDLVGLVILRGMTGTGKSTIAASLEKLNTEEKTKVVVCSADDFLVDESGAYCFKKHKLDKAHSECQKKAADSLLLGRTPVVANVGATLDQNRPYIEMAKEQGKKVLIFTLRPADKGDVDRCISRSVHGVPRRVAVRAFHDMQDFTMPDVVHIDAAPYFLLDGES